MIYHVYANQSNIGDWLSASGIQSLLPRREVVELLCDTPFVPATLRALGKVTSDDLVIIGGGGLFMDYFLPFWEGFQEMSAEIPFVIWGVGCCDRKIESSRLPDELVATMVMQSRLCVLRDALSWKCLGGFPFAETVLCPSIMTLPPANGEARGLLHVDHYDNVGEAGYQRMAETAQAFAKTSGRNFYQTNNLISAGQRGAVQKTLELYRNADLVLSSRLHGCIIALALGRRVLAVSGDHKIESFMHAAGLSDWVFDRTDLDALAERLETLSDQPPVPSFVAEGRRRNRQFADRVLGLLRPVERCGVVT